MRILRAGKEKRQALAVNFSWFVFKDAQNGNGGPQSD